MIQWWMISSASFAEGRTIVKWLNPCGVGGKIPSWHVTLLLVRACAKTTESSRKAS